MSLLEVKGLNAYYGDSHILFDVALRVERNEVVALLGRNGAGKSTTLKSLMGVVAPREGSIVFDGAEIAGKKSHAIARALIRDPKIILLDEPFEGLAPVIVRDLVKACRDLADAGQTIVLVEQNIAAALTLAQRAYFINNGHIAHEGPTSEIRARPQVLQRYLGV